MAVRTGAARALLLAAVGLLVAVGLLAAVPAARAGTGGGAGLGASTSAAHHRHHHHARRQATHRRGHAGRHRRRTGRSPNPLHSRAMWIWEIPRTEGGDIPAIIAEARAHRITTLIIKSSDGVNLWPQFTPALVSELHAAHLRVCAWQYVYGARPGVEANLGADAVSDGADCLVIDAETQYEGRYVAAQAYVHDLRKQIPARYPVALAGFPYVDYHPSFPYSVFLGPGAAQYDVPQMYWRAIGTSVSQVFAHTYAFNLPYERPIEPLGQIYGNPPMRQIVRFRQLARAYGAGGVSWWDWQEARARDWAAVSKTAGPAPRSVSAPLMGTVGKGAVGDLVVWIQEHLVRAGFAHTIDGDYGRRTRAAVETFQAAHRLLADGIVGPETWRALLRYRPAAVHWVRVGKRTIARDALIRAGGDARDAPGTRGTRDGRGGALGRAPLMLAVPRSARAPDRRDEIPAGLGAGRG